MSRIKQRVAAFFATLFVAKSALPAVPYSAFQEAMKRDSRSAEEHRKETQVQVEKFLSAKF